VVGETTLSSKLCQSTVGDEWYRRASGRYETPPPRYARHLPSEGRL
jgi:hypothetical protein